MTADRRPIETRGIDLEAPGSDEPAHELARAALDEEVGSLRWQAGVRAALLRALERQAARRA
jgi:hypothetical protein